MQEVERCAALFPAGELPFRCPVLQPDFAERFPGQVGEYQQRETHYEYAPDNGTLRLFHRLLLLAQGALSG